ncbi:MAG: hypothetical protein ACO3VQ_09265 [Ilumatobacteraceae bacterium]|jgi:hypothetical protein
MNVRWKVTIVRDDQTTDTFTVRPKTIVAFERHFKVGLAQAFSRDQKQEHVYWLGWESERAAGNVVKPFDQWLDTLVSVGIEVDSVPLDETP